MAPPSTPLLTAIESPRVLATMTQLGGPAPGAARIVGIVLSSPESVLHVENAPLDELSRERLSAHYPNALVVETSVLVGER
jgi:hypothetical protein